MGRAFALGAVNDFSDVGIPAAHRAGIPEAGMGRARVGAAGWGVGLVLALPALAIMEDLGPVEACLPAQIGGVEADGFTVAIVSPFPSRIAMSLAAEQRGGQLP